jgi:hypothetical protein
MSRKFPLPLALAFQCCLAGLAGLTAAPSAHAGEAIPDYFFREWTVTKNCTEAHAGLAANVQSGLKFRISKDDLTADGSYIFTAEDGATAHWAAHWNGLKLAYRAGTRMTSIPADFECIPSGEPTSPFLSMSGFAQGAEPYYEQEHWYGLAQIRGQWEHVLIFPRNATGAGSVIIVIQSVNSPNTLQLDDNGVVHGNN